LYFQRFQKIHNELEAHKDNLEELVEERTSELEDENEQRQKAEEGLRQTFTTLENIFNSTSPTCITSLDYELLKTNEAYRRIWPDPKKEGMVLKCYESRPSEYCHTINCPAENISRGRNKRSARL